MSHSWHAYSKSKPAVYLYITGRLDLISPLIHPPWSISLTLISNIQWQDQLGSKYHNAIYTCKDKQVAIHYLVGYRILNKEVKWMQINQ